MMHDFVNSKVKASKNMKDTWISWLPYLERAQFSKAVVADKRFVVALGKTNSGKGTLTEMLNNCFGLNKFIGNYDGRNLSSTGTRTLSWLYTNRNSRIILANEVDKNRAIDANVLKMCAKGGEPITATAKYMNEASFVP